MPQGTYLRKNEDNVLFKAKRDFIIFAVIGILDSDDGFNFLNPCNIFLNNKFLCDASKIQIWTIKLKDNL